MRIRTSSGSRMKLGVGGRLFSGSPPLPGIGQIFRAFNSNPVNTFGEAITYTKIDGTQGVISVPEQQVQYFLALSGSLSDNPAAGEFLGLVITNLLITSSVDEEVITFTEELITTVGSGSWTKPSGVTQVVVECWGGGGAGGASTSNNIGGAGAGGGAYCRGSFTYSSGQQSINYVVGSGGTGGSGTGPNGNYSTWDSTNVVAGPGTGGGSSDNNVAGTGGALRDIDNNITDGSTGTVIYSGGNGQVGWAPLSFEGGAAGGSGAGSAANGNNAEFANPGPSVKEYGGAGGIGNGGDVSVTGDPGSNYGGGGSGGFKISGQTRNGGSGAQGLIRLIYR